MPERFKVTKSEEFKPFSLTTPSTITNNQNATDSLLQNQNCYQESSKFYHFPTT